MKRSWALKLTLVLALLICVSPLLHMTPLGKKASADTTLSISDLAKKATTDGPCSKSDNSCIAGYVAGYKNADDGSFPSESDFCQTGSSVGGAQYKVTSVSKCKTGYEAGASQAPGATSGSTSAANGNPSNSKLSCVYGPLSWIVCPFVDLLVGMVGAIDTLITNELFVNTSQIFCDSTSGNCNDYFQAWQAFRNISLGLMAIAGLVILISQALGMEILDAYTIRKTLPRLLIAAIGITLSWPLMKFFVTFTNDLGFSVKDLILAPFSNLKDSISLNFGQSGIVALVGGLAAASLGIFGILSYMVTAALAVMIAVVVLILRQIVITLAIIVAPIGIVAYVLPNTQRVYKIWWETFSKALLMFPLIIAFIAAGRVFSAIALNTHSSGLGLFYQTIGFVAYFAPYFLIPLTFRFASGFLAAAGGFMNDRGRGGFDRLRNFRQKRSQARMQQFGQDIRAQQALRPFGPGKPGSVRDRVNKGLQKASFVGAAGVNPRYWRGNVNEAVQKYGAQKRAGAENEEEMAQISGYDDLMRAVTETDGNLSQMDAFLKKRGFGETDRRSMLSAWEVARKGMAKKGYSHDTILQAALLNGIKAKTAYRDSVKDENGNEIGLDYDEKGNYIGNARQIEDIVKLSRGNPGNIAQMIGRAQEINKSVGRQDEVSSFSDSLISAQRIANVAGGTEEQKAAVREGEAQRLLAKTIYKEGASAMVGGTAHATRHFAKTYQDLIKTTIDNVQTAARDGFVDTEVYDPETDKMETRRLSLPEADRQRKQLVAQLAYLQDVNGQLPVEKQGIVAEMLGRNIGSRDGKPFTIQDLVDELRPDKETNQFKLDIRYRTERDVADAAELARRQREGLGGDIGGNISGNIGGNI